MKVVFATPFLSRPSEPYIAALEASVPVIEAAGLEHGMAVEVGSPYISWARSSLARKALDAKADVIIFLDYDLSWKPRDLLTLIQTPGDVVAGTYRFKLPEEDYMGTIHSGPDGRPLLRDDGCIKAALVPAGFLKVTAGAIDKFMRDYPELIYGPRYSPSIDLFNHGVSEGVWWGEDYAFSRRWTAKGGEIALVPDLDIAHHNREKDGTWTSFPGNFHRYLLRQPQPEGTDVS